MANDPEQQLYEDMADLTERVPKLENEIKSLKRKITKLSTRIESLELMAFQDQIANLNDKIDSINKYINAIGLRVVLNELDFLQLHMRKAIDKKLSEGNTKRQIREYISNKHASAQEKARLSSKPFEYLLEFKKECMTYSKKYKLGAFTEKP